MAEYSVLQIPLKRESHCEQPVMSGIIRGSDHDEESSGES
jgi:hypothetical protein